MTALLEVKDLEAGYGAVQVLQGLDLTVDDGEVAVILCATGAGKTTTMRAISGMINRRGAVLIGLLDRIVGRRIRRIAVTTTDQDADRSQKRGSEKSSLIHRSIYLD